MFIFVDICAYSSPKPSTDTFEECVFPFFFDFFELFKYDILNNQCRTNDKYSYTLLNLPFSI